MKTKSIRHFTLVELLTVIVVMTILGGITIPLYNRLMTGSAVSYANRLVNSQLNMARVHACKKRRPVAVLFADYALKWKGDLEDTDKLQFAQRAFRCAYVKKNGDNWEFSEWVEDCKWEFLPKGAFFTHPSVSGADKNATHDEDTTDSNNGRGLYPINDAGYSVRNVTDDANEYFNKSDFKFAIIFKEDGCPVKVGTSGVSKTPRVRIAEGVVADVDSTKGVTVVRHNKYNYMISLVNRNTGAVSTKAPEIE